MLSFIGLALLVALFLWLMPLILALILVGAGVLFCLLMAAVCWVRELLTPSKRPNR